MVAGTDDDAGLGSEIAEILERDGGLDVAFDDGNKIKQIADDEYGIKLVGQGGYPVELLQRVVNVRDDQVFHWSRSRTDS